MQHGADVAHATITVTCTVPTIADNGAWNASVLVLDDEGISAYRYDGLGVILPFTVVGGSEDHSPPQLVSSSIDPSAGSPTSTFTITAKFNDQTGLDIDAANIHNVAHSADYLACGEPQVSSASTTYTVVWACTGASGHTSAGSYAVYVNVEDLLHNWVAYQLGSIAVS